MALSDRQRVRLKYKVSSHGRILRKRLNSNAMYSVSVLDLMYELQSIIRVSNKSNRMIESLKQCVQNIFPLIANSYNSIPCDDGPSQVTKAT